jgi:hypothetical protein
MLAPVVPGGKANRKEEPTGIPDLARSHFGSGEDTNTDAAASIAKSAHSTRFEAGSHVLGLCTIEGILVGCAA